MKHNQNKSKTQQAPKSALSMAFWLNLSFSIIEIVGGILTNSTAIIADALHDFMDALAIGGAVILEKIAGRKSNGTFSYGYKRFSLVSALAMSLLLIGGAIIMAYNAIGSFSESKPVHSVGMLLLAVLGIGVNGFAFLRMRAGGKHAHAHGHAHAPTHSHVHGNLNAPSDIHASSHHNSRAIMLHLLEDVLGWVAVLIGSVVIYFTGWYWVDGILALCIAAFITYNAIANLVSTMKVLLQSVPEDVHVPALTRDLQQINGLVNVHDLHVWSLDGSYNVASLHAVISNKHRHIENAILDNIKSILTRHNVQHPTIQLETDVFKCGLRHCTA